MSSDEESWPEVDELKTELLQALEKVDSSAVSFGCRGTVEKAPNPGIEVEGLGVLGLPLSSRDAELLITKCRQSPFGKGEDTVVDDSVRKSWELDPSQFTLANPDWEMTVDDVVDRVHMGLGLTCHRSAVEAQLYKLLIYEEGASLKPHQDSEKAPGMFGTLVICLPSRHDGGKVLLTHNRRKFEFGSANSSQFGTTYGAWYSDVLHEVEKVTSGCRVVLTYNLIQTSSLPQKAPDPDSKARIKKALEIWEHASANNEPDYPPYIIHQLEHFYSKNSANIGMLKGYDAAQVRCLEAAGKDLGYGVYLAVFERTVNRDDECGSEEFGREEEFECITELDGTPIDIRPEYDAACRLEDVELDDEADESEHEGYTGNEGAPATFWYRQTIVLLVPPSRKLGFGWTPNTKYKHAANHLDVLEGSATEDPAASKQLYRLCHLLLPEASEVHRWNKPRAAHDWSSSYYYRRNHGYEDYKYRGDALTKACLARVGRISLQHGWLDLYDRVPLEQKQNPDCLQALGNFLCTMGASFIKTQMDRLIKDTVNLAEKYRLLQKITEIFNERFVELSAASRCKNEFDAWYATAFADILGTQQRASKDDGDVLGEIARTCPPEVGNQILRKLQSASTQTIAAFVMGVTKEDADSTPTARSTVVSKALDLLWDNFEYSEPLRTHGASIDGLNQHELASTIEVTKKHGQIPMQDILKAISEALDKQGAKYIAENLLPFIHSIMKHEVPAVIVEDNPDLFDAVASYIQLVLCTYIRRLVGDEPKKPNDWSLPNRGCKSCEFCKKVGAFMADGQQRMFKEQYNGSIRKHLDNSFYGSKDEYSISVDKSRVPYFWICTKTQGSYKGAIAGWRRNRTTAQNKLKSIGGPKSQLLRTYLGEHFDAIVACQTENLPDLGSKELAEKTPLSNIDAASLNASNSKKRKLNTNDLSGAENDASAKRARAGAALPDSAEVIDLT